jgi:hypothetical protein
MFRPEERLPSSPSIPLAELLPLMRLPCSRSVPFRRGRPLTNADVAAAIDQVLNMLGDDMDEETATDQQQRTEETDPARHSSVISS